jgi:hypothetical protein
MQNKTGIGRLVFAIVVMVIGAAIAYLVLSQGNTGSVPDQTNDEMEVVPS